MKLLVAVPSTRQCLCACNASLLQGELSSRAAVPAETLMQISTMEKSIDALAADLAALSSQVAQGASPGRLEELGAQVAQMRERLAEMDRAVTALANTVAQRPEAAEPDEAPPVFVVSEWVLLSFQCMSLHLDMHFC